MPRLLIFVPCEKVIISHDESTLSLIAVLQEIIVMLAPGTPAQLPPDSTVPMQWYSLALWRREDVDAGKQYEQMVRLISEDGKVLSEPPGMTFELSKPEHRMITRFFGFPIGKEGLCSLKLYLREVGQDEWKEVASFPLTLKLTAKHAPPEQ